MSTGSPLIVDRTPAERLPSCTIGEGRAAPTSESVEFFATRVTGSVHEMELLAHGVGGRSDLPLPLSFFAWAAVAMLVVSFAALSALWVTPRLGRSAAGRDLGDGAARLSRALVAVGAVGGVLLFGVTVVAAFIGADSPSLNPAGFVVYVWLWVGLQFASALFGDVYAAINPLPRLARLVGSIAPTGASPPAGAAAWPAAVLMLGFHWLELTHHAPADPTVLAAAICVYASVVVLPCAIYGPRWQQSSDGLALWFSTIAALAPLERRAGRLHLRPPGSGLAGLRLDWSRAAIVIIVISGTAFDGLTRTDFWRDVLGTKVGWSATGVNTIGLVWSAALVTALYAGAARWSARQLGDDVRLDRDLALVFAPSLVPIGFAYSIAHYFSLFVFEGQSTYIALADPFDQGWNLIGTASWNTNYLLVSATVVALVQAISIIVGHLAATVVAHDLALSELGDPDRALRSQYPMLAAMIGLTLLALGLVLSA
ncbi:MAG: hypothetical protein P8N02_17470 [Actinomycetota bacterium]|nr:hypothetical protein [Actinomycetota bacterium]